MTAPTSHTLRTSPIDPSLTVNEIIVRFPRTIAVFNQFGIDTCCGGGVAVTQAAHRDGVDLETLLATLDAAVQQ